MKARAGFAGLAAVLSVLWACAVFAGGLTVTVSIVPQKYFVDRIGDGLVDVSVMVLPGAEPAAYEPKPRQMAALAKAAIYFAVGVPFESVWLPRIAAANRNMRVVRTEDGIEKMPIEGMPVAGEEKHGILDPHVWLSPPLVKIMARNIFSALVEADPGNEAAYQKNYNRFMGEIDVLDARIRDIFTKNTENREFMVFHPAWGYFAKAYGLTQVPIEEQGKAPGPRDLATLIDHARARGIRVIFAQPQFSQKSAEAIAHDIGGQVVKVDPLAYAWADNLYQVAWAFEAALK